MIDETMMDSKLYIIPGMGETRRDLLAIDRSTKEVLRQKHRLYCNTDWESNTIATVTIETLSRILYTHIAENGVQVLDIDNGSCVNFYELLEVTASNKKNKKAEKNGNINIIFYTGDRVNEIISDDIAAEDRKIEYITAEAAYSFPDDNEMTTAMLKIDKLSRNILADKYSIILPKDYMAIATTVIFIEELYRELVKKLVLMDKNKVSINFNDIIEFHATKKDDGVVIECTPGMGAKLIIKSDPSTENDELDED